MSNSQAVADSVCWFISCLNPWSSIHPFVHPSIYLSMHLFIRLSNTCLSLGVRYMQPPSNSLYQVRYQQSTGSTSVSPNLCTHDCCICHKFDRLYAVKHALQCACRHRITCLWWALRRATYTSAHKPTTQNTCRPTKVTPSCQPWPPMARLLRSSLMLTCMSSHRSRNFIAFLCIAARCSEALPVKLQGQSHFMCMLQVSRSQAYSALTELG